MLAVDAAKPPNNDEFTFEIKFDGFRCGAHIEDGRLKLVSRQGKNFSGWFPELGLMTSNIASADVLLDGEIIVGDGSIESFNVLLRRACLRGRSQHNALPVSFVAFDLLWIDGIDVTQMPLDERRSRLRNVVTDSEFIAVSRVYPDGVALLAVAAAHGLEGIVGKRKSSIYELCSAVA